MDTLFIKMCDCPEIQGQREYDKPYKDGDWWISKRWADSVACAWRGYHGHDEIWLPTQSQLQKMVEGTHIEKLGRVYKAVVKMSLYPSGSMEQLWLTFYMSEKLNKTWDGDKWVNK